MTCWTVKLNICCRVLGVWKGNPAKVSGVGWFRSDSGDIWVTVQADDESEATATAVGAMGRSITGAIERFHVENKKRVKQA